MAWYAPLQQEIFFIFIAIILSFFRMQRWYVLPPHSLVARLLIRTIILADCEALTDAKRLAVLQKRCYSLYIMKNVRRIAAFNPCSNSSKAVLLPPSV